jgi:dCMP deaminase
MDELWRTVKCPSCGGTGADMSNYVDGYECECCYGAGRLFVRPSGRCFKWVGGPPNGAVSKEWYDEGSPYFVPEATQEEIDINYMEEAYFVSYMSTCNSRQVGVVIVRDGCILGTGANSSPIGISLCKDANETCKRRRIGYSSGEGLEYCPAVHAEIEALLDCNRNKKQTGGATLYGWCCQPCVRCAGAIINAGIKRVVCLDGVYDDLSDVLFRESGVEITQISQERFNDSP